MSKPTGPSEGNSFFDYASQMIHRGIEKGKKLSQDIRGGIDNLAIRYLKHTGRIDFSKKTEDPTLTQAKKLITDHAEKTVSQLSQAGSERVEEDPIDLEDNLEELFQEHLDLTAIAESHQKHEAASSETLATLLQQLDREIDEGALTPQKLREKQIERLVIQKIIETRSVEAQAKFKEITQRSHDIFGELEELSRKLKSMEPTNPEYHILLEAFRLLRDDYSHQWEEAISDLQRQEISSPPVHREESFLQQLENLQLKDRFADDMSVQVIKDYRQECTKILDAAPHILLGTLLQKSIQVLEEIQEENQALIQHVVKNKPSNEASVIQEINEINEPIISYIQVLKDKLTAWERQFTQDLITSCTKIVIARMAQQYKQNPAFLGLSPSQIEHLIHSRFLSPIQEKLGEMLGEISQLPHYSALIQGYRQHDQGFYVEERAILDSLSSLLEEAMGAIPRELHEKVTALITENLPAKPSSPFKKLLQSTQEHFSSRFETRLEKAIREAAATQNLSIEDKPLPSIIELIIRTHRESFHDLFDQFGIALQKDKPEIEKKIFEQFNILLPGMTEEAIRALKAPPPAKKK